MSTVNLSRIKEIAEERRVTLADVARAAGITSTGLSRLMRENKTRVDTLQKISDFLGVPITSFFNSDPIPPLQTGAGNVGAAGINFSVNSDQNISRALDILEGQLRAKDEQISGLIKALNK